DGTQIAARIFHALLHAGPPRKVIGDLELFDTREIDYVEAIMLGPDSAGFDVILERLRHARNQKLISGATELGPHVGLFPFGRTVVLGEHAYALGLEAFQLGADDLVRAAADNAIAGLHSDVVVGSQFSLGKAAPEQRGSVTQVARTGRAEPDEDYQAAHGRR